MMRGRRRQASRKMITQAEVCGGSSQPHLPASKIEVSRDDRVRVRILQH